MHFESGRGRSNRDPSATLRTRPAVTYKARGFVFDGPAEDMILNGACENKSHGAITGRDMGVQKWHNVEKNLKKILPSPTNIFVKINSAPNRQIG